MHGYSVIMTPDFSYLVLFGALNMSIIGHLGYCHELLLLNVIKIGEQSKCVIIPSHSCYQNRADYLRTLYLQYGQSAK